MIEYERSDVESFQSYLKIQTTRNQKVVEISFVNCFEKDTEFDCTNLRISAEKTIKKYVV